MTRLQHEQSARLAACRSAEQTRQCREPFCSRQRKDTCGLALYPARWFCGSCVGPAMRRRLRIQRRGAWPLRRSATKQLDEGLDEVRFASARYETEKRFYGKLQRWLLCPLMTRPFEQSLSHHQSFFVATGHFSCAWCSRSFCRFIRVARRPLT